LLTQFLLLYVYGGDDYLVNLKVVSKTTKCHDFTVTFPVISKMHRDFADFFHRDFLTALLFQITSQTTLTDVGCCAVMGEVMLKRCNTRNQNPRNPDSEWTRDLKQGYVRQHHNHSRVLGVHGQ